MRSTFTRWSAVWHAVCWLCLLTAVASCHAHTSFCARVLLCASLRHTPHWAGRNRFWFMSGLNHGQPALSHPSRPHCDLCAVCAQSIHANGMAAPGHCALTTNRDAITCSPETRTGCSAYVMPSCATAPAEIPMSSSARTGATWTHHAPSAHRCGTTSRPVPTASADSQLAEGKLNMHARPHA